MKHILMISRCPPYPIHLGDRLIIYHLARELAQRGYAIDLLAFGNSPDDLTADYGVLTSQGDQAYFRSITIIPEPRRTQIDYLRRALLPQTRFPRSAEQAWSPEMWRAIRNLLARTKYDIVHMFGGIQVYEFRHAISEDIPAVIVPYESYSLYLRRMIENPSPTPPRIQGGAKGVIWDTLLNRLRLLMARQFERWMFMPYRRAVVVSQQDKDELLALNPALRVEVIPNGIDLDTFVAQETKRDAATLLFTGNFEYAPNIDAALRLVRDILPRVRVYFPEAKVWLVGNNPPPELTALASETVMVTGRVPDVRPYLAQATVFACPLRLGAGIKNKVLEALAMRLPVVATPLSMDGIAARDGEHVVIAESDVSLADGIVRLLQDAALYAKLSGNGHVLIMGQYSWARVADLYESLYQSV